MSIDKSASQHFDLRASPLWLAWLRALARADHRSASGTIEHALFKYAQTSWPGGGRFSCRAKKTTLSISIITVDNCSFGSRGPVQTVGGAKNENGPAFAAKKTGLTVSICCVLMLTLNEYIIAS